MRCGHQSALDLGRDARGRQAAHTSPDKIPDPVRASHVFCGVPTADFRSAVAWYERFVGRPPDNVPREDEAVWQLSDSGLIYVVADPERSGNGLLTLIVDDLDAQVAELAGRGIDLAPIETMGGVARRVTVADPDGNSVTVAQLISDPQ